MHSELEKGDLVWFDPSVGYTLPGEVVEYHRAAQVLTVQAVINGKPQVFTLTSLNGVRRRQDLGQNGIEDMIQLSDLNEASLLWNLKIRYEKELIYTYVGSILVAVNPYKMFDIYGLDMVKKYENQILGTLPPHLFAIGSSAYAALNKTGESQVVVISGESGAGKTESTKLVMQYLAAVNKSPSNLVTEQILEASPLLESFGNAKTVRNDNSSRFGKYLEVHFNKGVITGAKVTEYLLEKSRIVTQAPEERNYHVFYEMLTGLPESQRQSYGLLTPEKYFYLNQGGSCEIDGKIDRDDFQSLLSAMQVLGFTNDEQDNIFRILASVLHLGNVYFHRKQLRHGQEGVEIGSDAEIKWTAHLLKLNAEGIKDALMTKTTEARGERVQTPLTIDQSLDARDAFAKALYHTLFSWLVARINQIVYKGTKRTAAISILDIFGFEDFQENSFEQLCINYANENLQFYFNKHIFKLEQMEYAKEKIQWQTINYTDNVPIINLIAKKPVGILHLLDDESNFPKATDVSFLEKCHYNHALDELYSRPRMSSSEFGLKHYAGQVWYNVDGFLDKNRDTLRSDVVELLISSKIKLISTMFENYRNTYESAKTINKANGRFVTMKPRTPTVAARFHDSLQQLLALMDKCNPWFVRCIKPNNEKAPMKFDMPIVVEQLRYTGMLETIRIRKTGYPVRLKFSQFYDRYRYFLPDRGASIARGTPYRELCRFILEIKECNSNDYQLGTTRVFLRENLEREFEKERSEILHKAALTLQTNVRGYLARRKYQNIKRSTVKIQSAVRGWRARKKYKVIRKGIIATQARFRGRRQRKRYLELSAELKRRAAAEKAARDRAKVKAQKEEQERTSRAVAGVNHLEIPAELAFIFSKLDDWEQVHTERNLVKVVGNVLHDPRKFQLPQDIDHHAFTKFTNIYFKSHVWGMKREPIKTPFLAKAKDMDYQDSLALFKLILRFMNDNNLSGKKETVLGDYIVNKGLFNEKLRDEILCQLCNQTWNNTNDANNERGWLLMANCISVFPPSHTLYKYLLKYVSDHAYDGYKALCQRKLLQIDSLELPLARCYPPNILEWRCNRKRVNMALPLNFADGDSAVVEVDSWSTGEDLAGFAVRDRGIQEWRGWSLMLSTEDGLTKEAMGCDYVMDLISEMEIAPAFPVCKNSFLTSQNKSGTKAPINEDLEVPIIAPRRPANPPPQPPVRKQSRELLEEAVHTPKKPVDRIRSQSKDHTVESGLSRKSALNDRYFEDGRSRSLDNLLDPVVSMPYKLDNLGLSRSRLNDRYHSVDKIPSTSSIIEARAATNQEYMSKSEILLEENLESVSQRGESHRNIELNGSTAGLNDNQSDVAASSSNVNLDFDYQDLAARSEDDKGSYIKGHPRFIKSQYAGKRAPPGSHSSRAYIEKSDYTTKSSALSDTSEAPSLASHVRRVRVPSQASDVDQFLDDLFMPVLDGNLDELSDARSLAASIKGGGSKRPNENEDERDDNEVASLTSSGISRPPNAGREMENVDDYITNLFQPIFVNDSVNRLVSASTLASKIKGGGRGVQDKSSSQPGFTPISNMTSPTTVMPGMMSPPPVMMPLFTPTAQSSASLSFMGPGGVTGAAQTMSAANFYPTSPDALMHSAMLHSIPIYNIQGLNLPNQQIPDSNILAYQQNLQRAFLQSAMAQNIQIQQQLFAQNQALQQLLQQQTEVTLKSQQQTPVSFAADNSEYWRRDKEDNSGPPLPPKSKSSTTPIQSTIAAQVHREQSPPRSQSVKDQKPNFTKTGGHQSQVSDVLNRKHSRNFAQPKSYGIPAPPPLPPPPDGSDPHNRPFIDPYGRAKTVRIGKWRWPPPQDGSQEGSDSFLQFKMRQQRKTTPQKQSSQDSNEDRTEGIEWEEFDLNIIDRAEPSNRKLSAPTRKESKEHKNAIKSFELGAQRPTPGSIGKLRISSEMRHKLEMVTANHSVRSTVKQEKPSLSNIAPPRKLEDNRRILLEQQLAGRWGSVDSVDQVTRGVSKEERPDVQATNLVRSQVEKMEKTSPTGPAIAQSTQWRPNPPPAPVAPHNMDGNHKAPQPPSRSSSFYSTGMNVATPRSPPPPIQPVKRNTFNVSSDIYGPVSKEYNHQDYSRSRREENLVKKDSFNNLRNREEFMRGGDYKKKIEMDRRSSMSEQIDRIEIEESSEFLQPMDIAPPTSIQRQYEVAETKLYPELSAAHFTYNRIPWKLCVRKEVFSPNEKLTNPLAVHLVFCQIVKDVLESTCIRITREQRTDMKKLLDGYGITLSNMSSQNHKQNIKKSIVESAKEWETYFCRLYPVSGGQTNRAVQYLGLSHSGIKLIRREKGVSQDHLQILESLQFDDVAETSVPKSSAIEIILRNGGRLVLYTHRAPQIHMTIQRYIVESEKGVIEYVRGVADHMHRDPSVLNFRKGDIIKILPPEHYVEKGWLYGASGDRRGNFPCDMVEPLSREELITAQNLDEPQMDENGEIGRSVRISEETVASGETNHRWAERTKVVNLMHHLEFVKTVTMPEKTEAEVETEKRKNKTNRKKLFGIFQTMRRENFKSRILESCEKKMKKRKKKKYLDSEERKEVFKKKMENSWAELPSTLQRKKETISEDILSQFHDSDSNESDSGRRKKSREMSYNVTGDIDVPTCEYFRQKGEDELDDVSLHKNDSRLEKFIHYKKKKNLTSEISEPDDGQVSLEKIRKLTEDDFGDKKGEGCDFKSAVREINLCFRDLMSENETSDLGMSSDSGNSEDTTEKRKPGMKRQNSSDSLLNEASVSSLSEVSERNKGNDLIEENAEVTYADEIKEVPDAETNDSIQYSKLIFPHAQGIFVNEQFSLNPLKENPLENGKIVYQELSFHKAHLEEDKSKRESEELVAKELSSAFPEREEEFEKNVLTIAINAPTEPEEGWEEEKEEKQETWSLEKKKEALLGSCLEYFSVADWRKAIALGSKRGVSSAAMETIVEEPETDTSTKLTVREILRRFEELGNKHFNDKLFMTDDERTATLKQIQQTLKCLEEKVRNSESRIEPNQSQQNLENNRIADHSSGGWTGKGPSFRPPHSTSAINHDNEEIAQTSVNDGKHSLLQFAIHHFRQSPEKFEMLKTSDGSISGSLKVIEHKNKKNKEKGKGGNKDSSEWTWKEQVDLVKFTAKPIEQSLLQLDPDLSDLAVECFLCLMRYMGDLPMPTDVSEVKCVYTILMHCHKYEQLRDEVYCQLMKQTTNNKSIQQESCQRGWRLFSIVAAYFVSSDTLKPFLFKYLETAAYDKRRAYHGTAMVCLQNLRKTFKYGGRKNVPSVEEITAISAGRNSKRQIYRLPGGTEKVVNTKSTTVVQDVIEELCVMINVTNPQEMEEFSVYCIVEGDTFTMPLAREEYILDVTTELHKNHQVFYLIFCRSVWYFPLRLDSQLYVEVVFNQIAPDYLEGLLLIMPGESLEQEIIYDISKIAALLHRAADMTQVPTMKETKFLLPKPALGVRDVKPSQWVNMVQSNWQDCEHLTAIQAKAQVLDVLSKWPLFGSSFFAVKKASEPKDRTDHILALNRNGVHFIDLITHETLLHYPFSEVISTRKVKSEDGTLFLDMKCGNLMQQRITRLQTDQAHEISRLIRQYITMQQRMGANQL